MKKGLIIFLILASANLLGISAFAQCPMCKTAVESGMEKGHTKGKGLNDGILYLLATPYLAIAAIGGAWYYKKKNNN